MKKKILIILLLVLVLAIISVTIIYITNRNNIKIEELYGTWTLEENKTILDGKETSNMVPWRCVIELQKNNNMKLCYYNSDDNIECGTANYTYEGGILNIKDNDWYLKGKYYVTLEDANMLILKQEISKEEQTIIYYKRS